MSKQTPIFSNDVNVQNYLYGKVVADMFYELVGDNYWGTGVKVEKNDWQYLIMPVKATQEFVRLVDKKNFSLQTPKRTFPKNRFYDKLYEDFRYLSDKEGLVPSMAFRLSALNTEDPHIDADILMSKTNVAVVTVNFKLTTQSGIWTSSSLERTLPSNTLVLVSYLKPHPNAVSEYTDAERWFNSKVSDNPTLYKYIDV